jgi:Protein of unknown function (DUF3750)
MLGRMRRPSAHWLWLIPPLLFGLAYLDRVDSGPAGDWRSASRASIGLAPDPKLTPEPVVQVYAARAVRWRGYFGVHTWVAVKPRDAAAFTVYEVNGWRLRRTSSAVSVDDRSPDSRWFGNRPELLAEQRGEGVDELITRIESAVRSYPYANTYRVWPGPNSNTFVAHLLRAAPELRADLPATAIGKDYLGPAFVAWAPSGTGAQLNLYGVVGALAGVEEGLELNLLGLTFGVDPFDLALKLPMAGRFGWPRAVPAAAAHAGEQ